MLFALAVLAVVVGTAGIGVLIGSSVRGGKGKKTFTKKGTFVPYDPKAPWKGGYYE